MVEILLAEDKRVSFKNVLSRRLESPTEVEVQKSARMFEAYMKRQKLKPFGPMIIRTTLSMSGRDELQESEMLAQLEESPGDVADPYSFEPLVRLEGCLMARYTGPMDGIPMAYAKMRVHAFEHNLDLGPVTYTVLMPAEDGEVCADVFIQVMRWPEWGITTSRASGTVGCSISATLRDSWPYPYSSWRSS